MILNEDKEAGYLEVAGNDVSCTTDVNMATRYIICTFLDKSCESHEIDGLYDLFNQPVFN